MNGMMVNGMILLCAVNLAGLPLALWTAHRVWTRLPSGTWLRWHWATQAGGAVTFFPSVVVMLMLPEPQHVSALVVIAVAPALVTARIMLLAARESRSEEAKRRYLQGRG